MTSPQFGGRDGALLRVATRRIVVQFTVAVAVVVLAMSATALLVGEHEEHVQADAAARSTWAVALPGQVTTPGVLWLVSATDDGRRLFDPDAPPAISELDPRTLPDGATVISRDGRELVVWTGDKDHARVSGVYDMTLREREQPALIMTLVIASVVGILGALGTGLIVGRRAVRPLGQALAIQHRFVASASHELRTPLNVLRLRAELLQRRDRVLPPQSYALELEKLVDDTRVMGDVVHDLLLAAELEFHPKAGRPINLHSLATEVGERLQPLAGDRQVELSVTAATAVADCVDRREPQVRGDRRSLSRALTALVDNALAHTPEGGHVRIDAEHRGGTVALSVTDDGNGLDPSQENLIFERFARGTSRDRGRRFGLGLALVDEIARAHGGTVTIDSAPGEGATFTLVLPADPGLAA